MPKVTRIEFRMVTEGGEERIATFLREEKVAALMIDSGSLGAFLRDLHAAAAAQPDPRPRGERRAGRKPS